MSKKLYVQEGRSCTSKKGILGPGSEVEAKYFDDGEKAVKRLVEKKVIGETNPEPEKKQIKIEAPEMELSETVLDLVKDIKGVGVKSAIALFKEEGADTEEKQLEILEKLLEDQED